MKKGFTLVELLVSVAVLSILGVIFLVVFSNSLRGGNKAQIVLAIKQNGQSVLETMDKTIRSSDDVVCVGSDKKIIVIAKDGDYTRYRFDPSPSPSPANGQILQDNPTMDPDDTQSGFINRICSPSTIMGTDSIVLTDTNTKTGISVISGEFRKDSKAGYNDVITIKFDIVQGVEVTPGTSSVIDPIRFETSIQLR